MATDYSDLIKAIAETSADVAKECDQIEPRLFHEARATEATIEFNKVFGPGAQYQYAPEAAKREAFEQILAGVNVRLGRKLGYVEDMITTYTELVPPAEEAAAEPPTVEDAFKAEHNVPAIDRTAAVQLGILDELRRARLVPELSALPVPAVLARYEAALRTPRAGESASVIRLVEQLHAAGRLAKPNEVAEVHALTRLGKKIAEVRDARVPPGLKAWRETVKRVRKTLRLADAGGLKPIRPERKA